MNRDSIDFAHEPVRRIFRRMFLPTLVAMVSMVVLNITDGAFVGHGVGSDALAAVNIIAPVFMIMGGIGLMFGIGGSVVASIHLSHGKTKAAAIHATQAILGGFLSGLMLAALMLIFPDATCRIFGADDTLLPLAKAYLLPLAALMPLCIISNTGMFLVRLDGAPKVAMWINLLSATLNIVGDYVLIFPLGWGIAGAAIATSVSFALSGVIVLIYLHFFARTLRIYRLKFSIKSARLTLRNWGYQVRLGISAFLGEVAISFIIIIGNYQFLHYLGTDGVAAYSVACYLMPIAFMFGNAIVQSSQPIISFAYGQSNLRRIRESMGTALSVGLLCGIIGMAFIALGAEWVSTTFLPVGCGAWVLCMEGLPIFAISIPLIILNLVLIGYYQSTEQTRQATIFTLLRGVVFMTPAFVLLPCWLGATGLWLAQTASELVTLLCICSILLISSTWMGSCSTPCPPTPSRGAGC